MSADITDDIVSGVNAAWMKPSRFSKEPGPFAVLDLESKDGETQEPGFTRPFLVGVYDGSEFRAFRGRDCLRDSLRYLLTARFRGFDVYAHNGGKFDFLHFLPEIAKLGLPYDGVPSGSRVIYARILDQQKKRKKPATRLRLLDSMALLPMGLARAAKALGVTEKLPEFDLGLHEDAPEWVRYNRVDCIALYEVVQKYRELIASVNGEVGLTAASTAMRTFRKSYQTRWVQRAKETHEDARAAYYGGRVEIFREKGTSLRYYDINSCYPHVMRRPMPVRYMGPWKGRPPTTPLSGEWITVTHATVSVPRDTFLPPLPVRLDGKLIFPTGEFSGVWDSAELLNAEQVGATVEWGEGHLYRGEHLFREWVDSLYPLRDKSRDGYDEGLALAVKLLLNSLYGKFGMNPDRETIVPWSPGLPEGSRAADPTDPDCAIWYAPKEIDAEYIIPQIAAHVTSLARIELYRWMLLAEQYGELYYCDTDSVITTADLDRFCSSELGGLKDEGAGATYRGSFFQPKVYCLVNERDSGDVKVAMKGFRDRSPEAFERYVRGEPQVVRQLEQIGALAKKGFREGPQMRTFLKQARGADTKRIHTKGGITYAHHLGDTSK